MHKWPLPHKIHCISSDRNNRKQQTWRVAPCKGIQNILGFWIPRCGFRIPGTGFRIPAQWIPDSKKGWIPIFYCFNAFLCISFSCSNLAKLKDVVTMHNKFVFRFINYGLNVLQFCKGLWYNKEGDCPHRNIAETENNKHRITVKKRSETPTSQF